MCSIDISKYQINISNFRRVRSLGNGGFGEVYEVVDNQNRRYAAKVFLREKYPNQQTYNELVYREISIMIKESNPTTVNIRGFSTVDVKGRNNITILMNLEENGSLRDVIRRNEPYLDNTSKQIIFIGIVMGMCWLHKNNVIHRDLKPENILIDKNLYPHISDFGLAKVWENGKTNVQSRNWGTDGYMAPEIAFGSYTNAVDVYAFGFILYELITGTKASINRNIPMKKSFSDLINRCWSPCPENRPSFKEIFDLFNSNRSQYTLDGVDFERLSIYINFMVKGFNQKKQQQVQHQPVQKNQQQSYHQQSQPQNQHQQVNYMYSQQQQPHYQQSHSKGHFNQTPIQQVQHQPLEKNQQQVYHQQLHPQHQHQQVNYIYPQQQNHIQQNQQILYQVQPSETDDYDSSSNGNKRKHHKHKFSLKKLFKSSKTMSSEDDYY